MKRLLALAAALVAVTALALTGCLSQQESATAPDPASEERPLLATQYGSEILRPDGNSFYGHWWKIDAFANCQGGACCYQPCSDAWTTVDEPVADTFTDTGYITACSPNHRHQLTFANSTGPANLTADEIEVTIGHIRFDPSIHPWSQTLTMIPYVDGDSLGTASITCFQDQACDSSGSDWTVTFDDLSLSKSDLATLEIELIATGALRSDVFLDVLQIEADVSYSYPEAPVISSEEIQTQVPCPTAYVRFQVDSSGTTGKVYYGGTDCTSSVNTTVDGTWHYASFDVSSLPTKFYWRVEATYQGETTNENCNVVKKFKHAIQGCPAPTWWP